MESRDVSGALVALQTAFLDVGIVAEFRIQETSAGPRINVVGIDPVKAVQLALALSRADSIRVIRS